MKNTFLTVLLLGIFTLLVGCAAADAAKDEQIETQLQNNQKAAEMPAHTGMSNASKMMSPLTGY